MFELIRGGPQRQRFPGLVAQRNQARKDKIHSRGHLPQHLRSETSASSRRRITQFDCAVLPVARQVGGGGVTGASSARAEGRVSTRSHTGHLIFAKTAVVCSMADGIRQGLTSCEVKFVRVSADGSNLLEF